MKIRKHIFSIKIKLLLSVIGVVLLFLSFSTYFSILQTGEIIQGQLDTYGTSLSGTLANFCIEDLLSWNYPALQLSVDHIGLQDSQILGIKIFHNDLEVASYVSNKCAEEETREKTEYLTPVIIDDSEGKMVLGSVLVSLSQESYQNFLQKEINLLLILGLVLLVGDTLLSYWTVKVLVLNPLVKITEGAKKIGEGKFEHQITIKNKDEIGVLAEEVNAMTRSLRNSKIRIDKQIQDMESAKKEVEDEQNKTSAIISNLIDPILVINNELELVLVNPSAKKILKIDDNTLGKKVINCKDCNSDNLCLSDFVNIKSTYRSKVIKTDENNFPIIEEIIVGEFNDKTEKLDIENQKIYKVFTSLVKDERGIIHGRVKIFYDLTREKKIDKLKSEFISIAAHQLRTPSSGIKWTLQMILNGELGNVSDEAKKFTGKAYTANDKMILLINDLLSVSRMESGKFVYELEKINFHNFLNEIIEDSKIIAQSRGVRLDFEICCRKALITIDKKKIRLSIENLLHNAIKYSGEGSVVKVALKIDADDKDFMHISVKDQGIGISKKDQKRLFSKFFRGENAVRLQTEGSGLGLFIAKNVVETHHGKVWVESDEGKGSTFHMKLPIKLVKVKKIE